MPETESGRVGYLVNAFPVTSETFLVNEVRGVERAGVPVVLLALNRRQDRIRPQGTEQILAPVARPPRFIPWGWLTYLAAHLECLVRRPFAYLDVLQNDALRSLFRALGSRREPASWKRCRKRLRLFLLAPLIATRARRLGVSHLHAHYAKDPLEVAVRVSWMSGLTYSFSAHAKDLYTTPPERLRRRLTKARFALTCHPHGHQTLLGIARPEDRRKIHHIPHGLDRHIFRRSSRARRRDLIVAAGRLTPKKGFDTLIEACSLLHQYGIDFRCVILGEGRLRGKLERQIKRAGLKKRLEMPGAVDQRELARWFQRAGAVAVPSRVLDCGNRDGVPNVLLEAVACGAPIVSTPVGSIGSFTSTRSAGHLVPPDDPQALADALRGVLTQAPESLGVESLDAAANLDYRRSAKKIARLHRRVGSTRSPKRAEFRIPPIDTAKMIKLARRRVGRTPRVRADVESAIERAVRPGLAANAWREDLSRMAERRLWDEAFKARRADELESFVESRGGRLDSSKRILDLGCGRGGLSVALGARGIPVVSLDLRWRNCRVTRWRGQRYDLEVPAVNGRAEFLPFRAGSFDIVCLLEVLEHVADPGALLAEARRVCRSDGLCVVTVVNRWAHLDPHYRLWGINFLPRRLAEAILSRAGRAKQSWRDNQRLTDMHYFSFRSFKSFAGSAGFEVHDPWLPEDSLAQLRHQLGRKLSLGYNTVTLLLEPS